MKFAFSSNAFRKYTLEETISVISQVGYHGIEIMADVPHAYPAHLNDSDISTIRKNLLDHNLEISNINAFMHHADGDTYHPSWLEPDPALRAKRVAYTLGCIELAYSLGARTISTEPGGPLQGISQDIGFGYFLEGLALVTESARRRGIRILIEPEPGLLIENSNQFETLMQHLDPEVFGLNCDIGHFFCVGEDPTIVIRKYKHLIQHFHLEDIAPSRIHHHLMLGDGAIDLPAVLETIDEIGYEGFVTVELYTYEDDPVSAAKNAFSYLKKWEKRRPQPVEKPHKGRTRQRL